jgi:uncharacterized OsmC-like protein
MTPSDLKDLYDRKGRALVRRPAFGRSTGQARVSITSGGLACHVVEPPNRSMRVDVPVEEGGTNAGPHPGQLMRASIGACLAIGYTIWAARMDVPLDRVVLELTCDFDARGQLGISAEVPVGWQRLVVDVSITSAAPESDVRRVVQTANGACPMLANLSPAIVQVHRLSVVGRGI